MSTCRGVGSAAAVSAAAPPPIAAITTPVPALQDVCKLSEDTGPCTKYQQRFFFDHRSHECRAFIYGGCYGNGNNFLTKEECRQACRDPTDVTKQCRLPASPGPCRALIDNYYYDWAQQKCLLFKYGGCGGNTNRFPTEADCLKTCSVGGEAPTEKAVKEESPPRRCTYHPDKGPCYGRQERWYFDQTTGQCATFFYGGCQGNKNRFSTRTECEHACRVTPADGDVCALPKESGPCQEAHVKWFWDAAHSRCHRFYYSGCGGNQNRFDTQEACQDRCRQPAACPAFSCHLNCRHGFEKDSRGCRQCACKAVPDELVPRPASPPPPHIENADCRSSEFGCCHDGIRPATGRNYEGCPQEEAVILSFGEMKQMFERGESVRIDCVVRGHPPPQIDWFFERRPILPNNYEGITILNNGSLAIEALDEGREGLYTCRAYNGVGFPQTRNFEVSVEKSTSRGEGRDHTSPSLPVRPIKVEQGQELTLSCNVIDDHHQVRVYWTKDGTPLPPTRSLNGSLYFSSVEAVDGGRYECVVRGRSEAAYVVVVLPKPEVVIMEHALAYPEMANIKLRCVAAGLRRPIFQWFHATESLKTSSRIRMSNGTLEILDAVKADAGAYVCQVTGEGVVGRASTEIVVEKVAVIPSTIPPNCRDDDLLANCKLIVAAQMCKNRYYKQFCCQSCFFAGQLTSKDVRRRRKRRLL